jgi:N-acetylmuramoyl-L-alanine amidase
VKNTAANTMFYLIKPLLACVLLLANMPIYGATVISSSVLPISEYTRLTIETDQAIAHSILVLKNPDRIVIDLKNISINQSLKALASKVFPDNFYIKQVRVAQFKQDVTRIVVDLNEEAKSKLNIYKPAGDYQYRLALDIYPTHTQMIMDDSLKDTSATSVDEQITTGSNNRDSKSSGAKIILDTEPAYEPEEDLDLQQN